jgi:outer membrane lipoprotein-sorting protein
MAATKPAITDSSRLIALLYRADWRQLCLSAEVSTLVNRARVVSPAPGRKSQERADAADRANPRETWRLATDTGAEGYTGAADDAGAADDDAADDTGAEGQSRWREGLSRVLIAPGGRCRIESAAPGPDQLVVVCDGEKWWRATPDEAIGPRALSRPAGYAELLDPSWLISRFDTELIGPAEAAGRPAYRIAATPRPIAAAGTLDRGHQIDRVDILVDTEFGILLRKETFAAGEQTELTEVRAVTLNPAEAGDPAQFLPPHGRPGIEAFSSPGPLFDTSGPGWRVAKAAGRAASAAVAFRIRHAARNPETPESASPPMPEPGTPPAPDEPAPISDDQVNLLHRTSLPPPCFAAGMRKWADSEILLRAVTRYRAAQPPQLAGFLGPAAVWDAFADVPKQTAFQTARLQLAMPGRYRFDHVAGGDSRISAIACDGTRQWTVYPNRVVTGPAEPPSADWADLADPAWLLSSDWRLSAGGAENVGGRPGWRIWADATDDSEQPGSREASVFRRAAVVVDAELGILLRLAFLVDDRTATCIELHDVTAPWAGDPAAFRIQIPPGTRVVEASSVFDHIDIPGPVKAAWTIGKTGLAGASALAGWLAERTGRRDERQP